MNFGEYLFEKVRDTGRECIVFRDGSLTYQDLLSRVNSLSAHLVSTIGTGNECLILSENSPFFVIAYLAIIRSGNTALLVETQISDTQLVAVYRQCRIRTSFVQKKFIAKTAGREHVIPEDILSELSPTDTFTVSPVQDDAVAVVIFTS
ncbi:MAG: AMP-binding protein, partial [Methanoregula sp.]